MGTIHNHEGMELCQRNRVCEIEASHIRKLRQNGTGLVNLGVIVGVCLGGEYKKDDFTRQ